MKKILGLLLISSSIFSMELAYKVQTPYSRANAAKLSVMSNACKPYAPSTTFTNVKTTRINPSSVRAPRKLEDVELYHDEDGFVVIHDEKKHIIEKRFMDALSRKLTKEQLNSFLSKGYFTIGKTNDGSFTLQANHRLPGGGIIGSMIGAGIGKVAVSIVGHGAIILTVGVVSVFATPATGAVVAIGLESYFGAAIELASIKGAIVGGIAGGVLTGPI